MMKSILLLEPTRSFRKKNPLPLGLLAVHEYIKSKGVDSRYLDLFGDLNKLDYLKSKELPDVLFHKIKGAIGKYDVIGISTTYGENFNFVKYFCKIIKKHFPKKKIVVGGSNITILYLEKMLTLKYFKKYFDYVVLFDGEEALYKLLKNDLKNLEKVPNLVYLENSTLKINQIKNDLDLDKLPLIKKTYRNKIFHYETGRGCYWGKCKFCRYHQRFSQYREKSAKKIVADLKQLKKQIKGRRIRFINDVMSVEQALNLSNEIIKEKLDIKWVTYVRFEKDLTFEVLKKMKQAGCYAIRAGLESGDQKTNNKILNKGINLEHVERILRDCKKLGINTTVFLLEGFPGETLNSALKTTKFLLKNKNNIDSVWMFLFEPSYYCDYPSSTIKQRILKILKINESYPFILRKGFSYGTFLMFPFLMFNYFYFNMVTDTKFNITMVLNTPFFKMSIYQLKGRMPQIKRDISAHLEWFTIILPGKF